MIVDSTGRSFDDLDQYRMIAFIDVDGTLTDGTVGIDVAGNQIRYYHTRDSNALEMAKNKKIFIVLISSTLNGGINHRAESLGVAYFHSLDKWKTTRKILQSFDHGIVTVAFGDDINDLELLENAHFCGCPYDAAKPIKDLVLSREKDFTGRKTESIGGNGAVREFLDYVHKWHLNLFQPVK